MMATILDRLNEPVSSYLTAWRREIAKSASKDFLGALQPAAIGWKVANREAFNDTLLALQPHAAIMHTIWINGRLFADIGLHAALDKGNIRIVKLMQRRPGRHDTLGLDHIDFLSPSLNECKKILAAEQGLSWKEERNGNCQWIAISFAGREAKLRPGLALDAAIEDLETFRRSIMAGPDSPAA